MASPVQRQELFHKERPALWQVRQVFMVGKTVLQQGLCHRLYRFYYRVDRGVAYSFYSLQTIL